MPSGADRPILPHCFVDNDRRRPGSRLMMSRRVQDLRGEKEPPCGGEEDDLSRRHRDRPDRGCDQCFRHHPCLSAGKLALAARGGRGGHGPDGHRHGRGVAVDLSGLGEPSAGPAVDPAVDLAARMTTSAPSAMTGTDSMTGTDLMSVPDGPDDRVGPDVPHSNGFRSNWTHQCSGEHVSLF